MQIQNVVELHVEMRQLILKLKIIAEDKYDILIVDLEEYQDFELQEMYEWLLEIKFKEYKQLKYVWNLLPEEMWNRYDLFNVKGLREQGLLRKALVDMKKVLSNPYRTAKQKERQERKKSPYRHKGIK